MRINCITSKRYDYVWSSPLTRTDKNAHWQEWNSVVIKYRERNVQVWKHFKVYFKYGWNMSPLDINSVVFHFDDFNYGRRSQPYFINNWVIFQKMKTLCDLKGEISNWTNWHNFGRKIMSIWYIFQIQLLSAIYEDKKNKFNFY